MSRQYIDKANGVGGGEEGWVQALDMVVVVEIMEAADSVDGVVLWL